MDDKLALERREGTIDMPDLTAIAANLENIVFRLRDRGRMLEAELEQLQTEIARNEGALLLARQLMNQSNGSDGNA